MTKTLQVVNLVSYLVLAVVNFNAVWFPVWGLTPGDVSDRFPNSFTPPDFTFSIWTFIYILLGVFAFNIFTNSCFNPEDIGGVA